MFDKKRAEVLKDYLRKWDWKLFPLMPIAEEDAVYLLKIIDMYDKDRKRRREYSREEFVWDNFDVDWVIEEPNGGFIRIEQKTDINLDNVLVSAGTSIDVLMDYFKHHTSEVIQRVVEKEFPNAIPTDDT